MSSTTDLARRLRETLSEVGYDFDSVAGALGPLGLEALGRNETTPGLRATGGGSALETLVRLWPLQSTITRAQADVALGELVDPMVNAGFLVQSVGEVAARVDIRPHASETDHFWVASDHTPGMDGAPNKVSADYVLGASPAAISLAQLTVRDQVESALDLGTGCGVQSLHLTKHAGRVVATDVNERALKLARFNADLNEVSIDIRRGSYFEPVLDEGFDLIATNPPFVISPATGERLVYRDSGLPGDRVIEHVVRKAPEHLNHGGIAQVLANWMILKDQPWDERLAGWVEGADALVVQREVVDLPTYVELWLKDEGAHGTPQYRERYDTWLSWFDDQGAEAIGFGWINLRRTDTQPKLRFDDWPYPVEQPIGPAIAEHFSADLPADLNAATLVRRPDVIQETTGPVAAEDPAHIVLRQQLGFRRARSVTTAEAALVGACDGELTIGQIQAALSQLQVPPVPDEKVRELAAEGFLIAP